MMKKTIQTKHRYHVVESIYQDDIHTANNGVSYGIVSETDPNIFVLDISTDETFVADLNRKCNKANLSPIHLMDVVEDALP